MAAPSAAKMKANLLGEGEGEGGAGDSPAILPLKLGRILIVTLPQSP
jgi:hypothetical protein